MKPLAELSAVEVATVNRVVATRVVTGVDVQSWDVSLHTLRGNEAIASDAFSLTGPDSRLHLDDLVDTVLGRIGLLRVADWEIGDGSVLAARTGKLIK